MCVCVISLIPRSEVDIMGEIPQSRRIPISWGNNQWVKREQKDCETAQPILPVPGPQLVHSLFWLPAFHV